LSLNEFWIFAAYRAEFRNRKQELSESDRNRREFSPDFEIIEEFGEREREIAAEILAINRNNNRDESSCLFVYIPAVILATLTIARRQFKLGT